MSQQRHLRVWTWSRRITAAVFLSLLALGQFDWFPWFKGSTSATQVFGWLPFTDPLAALEVTLATRDFSPTVWLGAASLIAIAMLLGPVFCGWVCPLGLILDIGQSVRKRVAPFIAKRGLELPNGILPRQTKYAILAGFLGFSLVAQIPLFQIVSPINLVSRAVVFTVDSALIALFVLLVIELFAPRLWCRSLCPLGALYTLLGQVGRLRVRVNPDRAGEIRCQRCDVGCPMGIQVMEDYPLAGRPSIDHADCTRCGTCVDVCPNSVLSLGFRDRKPVDLSPSSCAGYDEFATTPSVAETHSSPAASPRRPTKQTRL